MKIAALKKLLALLTIAGLVFSLNTAASPGTSAATSVATDVPGQGQAVKKYKGTMDLTDEPGNWFKSDDDGTPVIILDNVGGRVSFRVGDQTDTRHTVTLLIKPTASSLLVDQPDSIRGSVGVTFDVPGVFLFTCKVHPYMQGVVAVRDAAGNIPPVTREQLPFIGHLGVDSLDAATVLSVLTA